MQRGVSNTYRLVSILGGRIGKKRVLQIDGFVLISPQCPRWIIVCGGGHSLRPLHGPCCSPRAPPWLLTGLSGIPMGSHHVDSDALPVVFAIKGNLQEIPVAWELKTNGQHLICYFFIRLAGTRISPGALGLAVQSRHSYLQKTVNEYEVSRWEPFSDMRFM